MALEDTILSTTEETEAKRRQREEMERQQAEIAASGGGPIVTPGGAAGIGADEDQAKMFGTPAQKDGALQEAAAQQQQQADLGQDEQLGTALGEQSFEDSVNSQKAAKAKEFTESMQEFGSLGSRVEQLVLESFKKKEGTEGVASFTVNKDSISSVSAQGADADAVESTLNQFSELLGSGNQADAFKLMEENSDLFSGNDILGTLEQVYNMDEPAMRQLTADAIASDVIDPGQVTLERLMDTYPDMLGLTPEQLEQFLGPDWKNLTPEAVDDKLEGAKRKYGSRIAQLQESLADPNLSAAARTDILQELAEAGATGELQTEAEGGEAIEKTAAAETLRIGGETKSIQDILSDENIVSDIQAYLEDPDREINIDGKNVKWSEEFGDLAAWVDTEMSELEAEKGEVVSGTAALAAIQEKNREFREKQFGTVALSKETLDALGFGSGIKAEEFKSTPLYEAIGTSGDPQQVAIAFKEILDPSFKDSGVADYIKKVSTTGSPDEIKNLTRILANPELSKNLKEIAQLDEEWAAFDHKNAEVTDYTQMLFGKSMTPEALTAELKELQAQAYFMKDAGPHKEILQGLIDAGGDPDAIKEVISGLVSGKDFKIEDLINSNLKSGGIMGLRDALNFDKSSTLKGPKADAYRYLTTDPSKANFSFRPGGVADDTQVMSYMINSGMLNKKDKARITEQLTTYVNTHFDKAYGTAKGFADAKHSITTDPATKDALIKKITDARNAMGQGNNPWLDAKANAQIKRIEQVFNSKVRRAKAAAQAAEIAKLQKQIDGYNAWAAQATGRNKENWLDKAQKVKNQIIRLKQAAAGK